MWRYFVGAGGALLLAVAGMFLFRGTAAQQPLVPPPPAAAVASEEEALPDEAPSASAKTREQKRFDRYDKDRNDAITRDEYLASRRKAFAKLDINGDGKLGFDEWAAKTTARFTGADKDKSGTLTRAEFLTTAPKRKPAKPKCACPKPAAAAGEDAEE
ncbi:histidine kinase [Sphingomonas soli]|uniref:histidine kinase n=1 Tax=Sphingomonas soli TaxID=266127 RepID=UPI000836EF12|nr:histidine kinase [Sphingomonas soli]